MAATGSTTPAPRKSDRTRDAILRAARRQFARSGYDRASIRSIATEAKIDPAMVMRYFGSKESLFAAAVDTDLRLPDLRTGPAGTRGHRLAEHFMARWEADLGGDALALLLRSAVAYSGAADRLRDIYEEQLVETLRAVVEPGQLRHRAGLVASQLLGVALCRYMLGLPGIADRPAPEIVAEIGSTIQRYLTGPLPAGTSAPD